MSTFIGKHPCPKCKANGNDKHNDNLAEYEKNYYCFKCQHFIPKEGYTMQEEPIVKKDWKPILGSVVELAHRRVEEKACRMYGYQTAVINGKTVEIANYYRDGVLIGQHLRGPNKQFAWKGEAKNVELFGQHLWKGNNKRLIITEGEIDCMTVAQLMGYTWAVVSLPNGAASAVKSIKDNLEFVNSYNEIVLCFDMDDPGQKAAIEVAEILPPGKCKIAKLPFKDANECLANNQGKAVVTALWEAQPYSPDEILHVSQIINTMEELDAVRVYPFPFDALSEYLIGQRSGEITLWASGTGSGKSTILRELMMHHLDEGRSVGAIMLEESPQETMDDMISLIINKPVRAIRASRMMNELRVKLGKNPIHMSIIDNLSDTEYGQAKEHLGKTSFYIYDHLGNNAMSNLLARMEYMAVSLKVDVIVLDHITAAAAGLMGMSDKDVDGGNSERIIIDNLMKELRALAVRTGVHIDIVSQLKKTDKAYEEGDRITLQDLRGSGALASVPNTVVALERDRQNSDDRIANTTMVRVLKNRLTGRAGVATALYYDHNTGRLTEIGFATNDDGEVVFEPTTEV